MRTAAQVIHDSLQEWNVEEFVDIEWNAKAAERVLKDLNEAGYVVAPGTMLPIEPAPAAPGEG